MSNEEKAQTPDGFLKDVGTKLAQQDGVDGDLAAILSEQILSADVSEDVVMRAKAAIIALAKSRAEQSVEAADE